jgi:hypothetical protein
LPLLGEYSDSGYREPKDRFIYSLRSNARYQLTVLTIGAVGAVYFFLTEGFNFTSLKGLVMALAYAWGLILAIYLMGHGLVSIPKRLYHDANPSRRLRRLQAQAPRIHDKLLEATDDLSQYEQQVFHLKQRKNGTAAVYKEWIDELDAMATVPEARIMASVASARLPSSLPPVPHVITDRYLADLTRKLKRARHKKIRYLSEWEHLILSASRQQAILDSFSSKKLDFGKAAPYASFFEKATFLTPHTRYLVHSTVVPALYYITSAIAALSSICIIWSEIIKGGASKLSLIGLTVVHHRDDSRGLIGFAGQCLAAFWLCYMCTCALWSVTEVKVWGNRALVRRGTYEESACWYAGQVAKLTVPLSYNFVTMMPRSISEATTFHNFLGKLVELTPLGKGFSGFYPILVLLPVVASLFGLYSKIKGATGFGDVIDEEEGLGGWREGKALIEREVRGHPGAVGLTHRVEGASRDGSLDIPRGTRTGTATAASSAATRSAARPVRAERQRAAQLEEEEDEGNFMTDFAHRLANTFSAADKPVWLSEGFRKPAWMGGQEDSTAAGTEPPAGGISRWFGKPPEGRVRL